MPLSNSHKIDSGKYSVLKNCRPIACLLMFGRLSCLVTDFCCALIISFVIERVMIC